MKTKIQALVISAFLMVMVGCSNLHQSYVEADLKTYKAVSQDLVDKYSEVDDEFERKIKLNTVRTWGARIEEALKHEDLAELRAKFVKIEIPE